MRVLLDSNVPRAFATLLPGHRTQTTHQRRWSDLDDGPLLDAAEREFDVLRARRNSLPVLAPIAPAVLAALAEMPVGELRVLAA